MDILRSDRRWSWSRLARPGILLLGIVSWLAGATAVPTTSDLHLLGAFLMPQQVDLPPMSQQTSWTTTAWGGCCALRRVQGQVRLFAVGHAYFGGVYEVAVPSVLGTGRDFTTYPTATLVQGWGDITTSISARPTWPVLAATATTLTVGENQYLPDDVYTGLQLSILSGTGAGQVRTITGYQAASRTATIDMPWSTIPDDTATYAIYQGHLTAASDAMVTLDGAASTTDNAYTNLGLAIVSGPAAGEVVQITGYVGATATAAIDPFSNLSTPGGAVVPGPGDCYRIVHLCRLVSNSVAANTWYASSNGGNQIHGLYWDEQDQRLYWSYANLYTPAVYDPCLGFSCLDDTTSTAVAYGPWRFSVPSKAVQCGMTGLPASITATTGAQRLGIGLGGVFSIETSCSQGPCLCAIAPPAPAWNAPDLSQPTCDTAVPTLPATPLVYYDTGSGIRSERNPYYINRPWSGPWIGTAQGGTPSTIVLGPMPGHSVFFASTGALDGDTITITAGPGAGEIGNITQWDYQSQTATIAETWPVAPVAGASQYLIAGGTARGGSTSTITLKTRATDCTAGYTGSFLTITAGTGMGQAERQVTAWDPATCIATVQPAWEVIPDATSQYEFYGLGMDNPDPSDGVGWWQNDAVTGGAWIDTPTVSGMVFFTALGIGHGYYQCSQYNQDQEQIWWHVYDPAAIAQVAAGTLAAHSIQPANWAQDPFFAAGPTNWAFGATAAAAYDPVDQRLYVIAHNAYPTFSADYPIVYVYQVGDPSAAPPAITSSLLIDTVQNTTIDYAIQCPGATSFAIVGAPAGFTCDPGTGIVQGTATQQGVFTFTLQATGPQGTSSAALVMVVQQTGSVPPEGLAAAAGGYTVGGSTAGAGSTTAAAGSGMAGSGGSGSAHCGLGGGAGLLIVVGAFLARRRRSRRRC